MGSSSRPGENCTNANLIAPFGKTSSQNNVTRVCSPLSFVAEPCAETPACVVELCTEKPAQTSFGLYTCFMQLTWWLNLNFWSVCVHTIEVCCVPCNSGFPSMLVLVVSMRGLSASRATGTKRMEVGRLWSQCNEVYIVKELHLGTERRCTKVERGVSRITSQLCGSACKHKKNAPDRSTQDCDASGNVQKTAQIAPESAREIGLRLRGCAATSRWVARDPAAREAAQVEVRSKFYAKNVETTKSSKLALAEELAILGGCEPIYHLSEVTLLTVAGALDSAGYRSASSYIAELRLRHVELDFAISLALNRTFKKVNDAVSRGFGPVKKAPVNR